MGTDISSGGGLINARAVPSVRIEVTDAGENSPEKKPAKSKWGSLANKLALSNTDSSSQGNSGNFMQPKG